MDNVLRLYIEYEGEIYILTENTLPFLLESGNGITAEYQLKPFPDLGTPIEISNFTYDANRMGGAPSITATVKHPKCLDDLWSKNVYAEFRGERYYVMNTPSSSKDNTDTRYSHEIELLSEREALNHVYFLDAVQGESTVDVYKSNSTKVIFFGDVNEFVGRLNACLSYQNLDYTAVVDKGVTSEDKQVSFEDKYILEALQEIFNVYEIPYYFVGKVIHVGFTENTITYPLKYGFDEALLSISKQNANYALINKIKGQGSSDNIPYYYPNNSPKGDIGIKIVSGSMEANDFIIEDYVKLSSSMSFTDVCSVRSVVVGEVSSEFVWSINGKDIELENIGIRLADGVVPVPNSSFMLEQVSYITPMPNLMPSIYRESLGAEQFYEARNNTYEDGEGGYYEFENEYSDTNQRQGTTDFEDIKPTIEGMTNASGQRIDMFSAFAYDKNDNDETDEEGNYIHSYFFAKLRKFDGENGFNLFDHAIESQAMQISFTSGVCGACTFEIGVGEETQKNIVQVDDSGNLKRDAEGNVLWRDQTPQDRQNDTRNYEVWIALKKEDSTYGIVFPNASQNLKPSTSDTFVILGINLPSAYITAAEKRLEQSLIKYMWMNNTEKFTFSIKFSRIFFTEHPEVLEQLNENSRVLIEYNGQQHTLYVDNFTYKTDDSSPLPEIEIDLVDTLSIGKNSLQTQLDSVKQDILSSIGGGDFLKQGLKYFLRKDVNDVASGKITFRKGLNVGEFIDSMIAGKGIGMFSDGRIQADRMELRSSLTVLELIYNRLSAMEGDYSFSESGTVDSVTLMEDGTYTLKLRKRWENDSTALKENDIIYGVVNNLASGSGEYYTSWARVLSVDTPANSINVVLYHDSEVPGGKNYPPVELMALTRRGNPVNEDRQSWWYLSSREGCLCMLDGVTKPVLEESNYSVIVGKLKQLSIFDNLPINYRQSYAYCRGIAVQDVMRIDYQGNPIRQENQRGLWSAEEAVSNPYQSTQEVYDSVYHYGCKWMCLLTGTTQEPRYGCTDWAMIEGNPAFSIDIKSSNGWYFDAEKFATTLSITGMLYNRDVTAHILDEDVSWTRDTGNVTEDNAWTAAHAESGKVLPLTLTDLGPDYMNLSGCKFIVKAILRDGQDNLEAEDYRTF